MTDAVMFNPMEKHSSCSYFIQENILALEEVFVPLQSEHGHEKSLKMFLNENKMKKNTVSFEITLSNFVLMEKLMNAILWIERIIVFSWTNGNDFKFPGIL
jgi:hypothetical protein